MPAITLYVSETQKATWDDARRKAEASGRSLSEFVTTALMAALDRAESQPEREAAIFREVLRVIEAEYPEVRERPAATKPGKARKGGKR